MSALPSPWVVDGKHYCPVHRNPDGSMVRLSYCADDYAHPTEWYECPVDRSKYVCDHQQERRTRAA